MSRTRLKKRLAVLLASRDAATHLQNDPVSFVHRATNRADKEVVALIASSLAFGNVKAVRNSIARVLERVGPRPAERVAAMSETDLRVALRGFVHRVYRGDDVAGMLFRAAGVRREHGSLGQFVLKVWKRSGGDFQETLTEFADALRGSRPTRGMRHLIPDPRSGSACKRLLLLFRWMVRPDDGVDLGLWPLPPSALFIPVDTHIHRIARNLRLTDRNTADWKTSEEITEGLRKLDPVDPVKFDFALCHLGVSRECPSRRVDALCQRCVLKSVCRQWEPRPRKRADAD